MLRSYAKVNRKSWGKLLSTLYNEECGPIFNYVCSGTHFFSKNFSTVVSHKFKSLKTGTKCKPSMKIKDAACGYNFSIYIAGDSQIIYQSHIPYYAGKPEETTTEEKFHIYDRGSSEAVEINKIACGRSHSLIASTRGVWAFGNNGFGQCGRPSDPEDSSLHKVPLFEDLNISDVICGQDSSFVLVDGEVYSCGWSADGQTGSGSYENQTCFKRVQGDLSGRKIIKVAGSSDTILALTEKGEVIGWGNSEYQQLSLVTKNTQINIPLHLPLNVTGRIIDIAASGCSCYVLTDLGEIWSWGYGTLGRGPKDTSSDVPQRIPSCFFQSADEARVPHFGRLFCGPTMVGALTNTGKLYAWGVHLSQALGHKARRPIYFPVKVDVEGSIRKVAFGFNHLLIL